MQTEYPSSNPRRMIKTWLLPLMFALLPGHVLATDATGTDAGILECILIADATTGNTLYERGECTRRVSPCSSFKLPLALMGFDSGILQSPESPRWTLKPEFRPLPSPRDREYLLVSPALWQSDSVVWFSQQLTQRLGSERFAQYVQAFKYGNQDVSGDAGKNNGLTQSWLMSSLAISPREQVRFLRRFVTHQLPVSESTYDRAQATIPQYPAAEDWRVHGKSGSGWLRDHAGRIDETRPQGWFVGWAEKNGRQIVFARLEIGNKKSDRPGGTKAREVILRELPVLMADR